MEIDEQNIDMILNPVVLFTIYSPPQNNRYIP